MARVNVQNVFRKVIEAGYYESSWFMCLALVAAEESGIITREEMASAKNAIAEELEGCISLRAYINKKVVRDLDLLKPQFVAEKIGTRIYWNWYDRKRIYARMQKKYSKAVVRGS